MNKWYALDKLCDKIYSLAILKMIQKFDDMRVVNFIQNFQFLSCQHLYLLRRGFVLPLSFILYLLYCVICIALDVLIERHITECTFAKFLEESEWLYWEEGTEMVGYSWKFQFFLLVLHQYIFCLNYRSYSINDHHRHFFFHLGFSWGSEPLSFFWFPL